MSKSPETPKPRRNLKTGLAVGALSLVAAVGTTGSALANKAKAVRHPRHAQPTAVLRERTEARINHRQPVEVYNGTLTLSERRQNPRTHRWGTVISNIDRPLVVFRGIPKAETPRDPVASGDYAFGSVVDKMGRAVVDLVNYDPKTMTLTPNPLTL